MSRYIAALVVVARVVGAAVPSLDFDRMGRVALVGPFAGIDLFQNDTVQFDPATSTLFARDPSGALTRLANTNTGGTILAGCQLADQFYFGGLFSSIDGVAAPNVASYSSKSNTFGQLGSGGTNGQVEALYCDEKENKVWVGGSFSSPASAVAVWNPASREWEQPPFGGLSGAQAKVSSITVNATNDSIFFAGSFVATFGDPRQLNGTSNPRLPPSAGATPFSSSLVPVPVESIRSSEISASPSTTRDGFTDIRNALCPAGDDGPGNSWFAQDGTTAVITVRTFSFISASGIRLGNTFQDGRGTTAFSMVTIPDNQRLELQYFDPAAGENRTCTDNCPLSTDSSIPYQDFLFVPGPQAITGVEIRLTEHRGASAGLHILQILSSGAFASSLDDNNGVSCYAPARSNTTRIGDWSVVQAPTGIAGTTQLVLVASIPVATRPDTSFTWRPYVSAAGIYDINILIPGCANFQDCDRRTSVKVTVFPGDGLPPNVMTISQQRTEDASVLVYSGPILPTSPDFVTTVTMALADDPVGNGADGRFDIVADRVQLVLRSANVSSTDPGNNSTTGGGERGFGFLEWPRSLDIKADGTNALPNASITALDKIGFDLLAGVGSLTSRTLSISAVAHHPSGVIFLGGDFSLSGGSANGASNIVAFKDGALTALSERGLDDAVTSLVLDGDLLFVGGSFRDTSTSSTNGKLRGVAVYNIQTNTWGSLKEGVNGKVSSLAAVGGRIQILGDFTEVHDPETNLSIHAGGFATWDVKNSVWVNPGGYTSGRMSLIAPGSGEAQFVAGNVANARKYGAAGMVFLQNADENGLPKVSPLSASLGSRQAPAAAPAAARRRHVHARANKKPWSTQIGVPRIFARQSSPNTLVPLPAAPPAPAPAVLAGAFWQDGDDEVTVLGGNFSYVAPGSSNVAQALAIYNEKTGAVRPLAGSQLSGVVRTVLVDGDRLYVGGELTLADTRVNGIAIYDLKKGEWDVDDLQPLQAASGSSVVVRSITKSAARDGAIVVAGSFTQAGSLPCQAICSLEIATKQWNALGSGIQGEVSSVVYAGNNQDILFVGGSLRLSDNEAGNVLQYAIANSTWKAVGSGLPGPVTALELNNGNVDSVFAAGQSESGSPFLSHWDGSSWKALESTLAADSQIAHLAMVPLQNTHEAQGVIEEDRVLMVSGALVDSTHGNVSSALYDGKTLIPYILSSSLSGSSGSVAALFRSFATFSFDQRKFLAVGIVILISIAIAAGVVFLLALIGILWTLFSRKDEKLNKYEDENDEDSTHHRPSSLLEHINAATRTTILGTSPYPEYSSEKEGDRSRSEGGDPFGPDAGGFARAETPSDAMGGVIMAEEASRPAHARYSFDGNGEGELPISAGDELEVLDDRDPAWWYARHVRTGREGVVPAAYLY